ncbi:hypothetical protein J23TS9_22730 [Paenibacillus sp. J23TS9]|uniref:hypothetical protein n=1 Tax=Paenibacillus sp. J23TS9 TaxID=2807193 RepID=UPI001AFFBFEF|nr:hypothetical protein [Paenibacillus sp. J23TS9]GIP27143.1 hypothetical protein J23TS9_22730 [Paenibacillus sp. J23TS9]
MNRRGAGVAFVAIAAFLFGIRYLTAVMLLPANSGWSWDYYHEILAKSGGPLLTLSILSLVVGIIYLVLADFKKSLLKYSDQVKENWNQEQEKTREWDESLHSPSSKDDKPSL